MWITIKRCVATVAVLGALALAGACAEPVPSTCISEEDCNAKIDALEDRASKIKRELRELSKEYDEKAMEMVSRGLFEGLSYSEIESLADEYERKEADLNAKHEDTRDAINRLSEMKFDIRVAQNE